MVGLLSGFADSIGNAGRALTNAGEATAIVGPLLNCLDACRPGWDFVSYLIWPLTWLRDQIQVSSRPVWVDFAATAAIVSILLFRPERRHPTGWRSLIVSLAAFAAVGVVIAAMASTTVDSRSSIRGCGAACW